MWLDPELIHKIINDSYYYECPNCHKNIHLITKILINCPKGMFWIATDETLENKRTLLRQYQVIDEKNQIIKPKITDRPQTDLPDFKSFINKEFEKLKHNLENDKPLDSSMDSEED